MNWPETPKRPSLAVKIPMAKLDVSSRREGSASWIGSRVEIPASQPALLSFMRTARTGRRTSKSLTPMRSINSFAKQPKAWKKHWCRKVAFFRIGIGSYQGTALAERWHEITRQDDLLRKSSCL